MKDREDVGIAQEHRIGRPPGLAPSTRDVPPTDEELLFLDRLRNADTIGSDGLMLEVMRGKDITKPAVINACIDLIQYQRRMDAGLEQLRKQFAQEQVLRSQSIKGAEDSAGEQIAELEKKIGQHAEDLRWRSRTWLYRAMHRKQRPAAAGTDTKAKDVKP